MNKRSFILVSLICFLGISAMAGDGITGKWTGTSDGPQGQMELNFEFKAVGDTLTGSLLGPMGEVEITNGKIDGKKFSFDISFDSFVIGHQCELISEDEITMKTEMMEMVLKRVKE